MGVISSHMCPWYEVFTSLPQRFSPSGAQLQMGDQTPSPFVLHPHLQNSELSFNFSCGSSETRKQNLAIITRMYHCCRNPLD